MHLMWWRSGIADGYQGSRGSCGVLPNRSSGRDAALCEAWKLGSTTFLLESLALTTLVFGVRAYVAGCDDAFSWGAAGWMVGCDRARSGGFGVNACRWLR